jgi:photosystem II stability/assembly factor-like uncharacterized protein
VSNWKNLIFFGLCIALLTVPVFSQNFWNASKVESKGDLVTVFFNSSTNGWIAGDEGYLAFTNDGGRSWTPQEIATDDTINEIFFRNSDNGYLVTGKKMFVTKNGGRSWDEIAVYRPGDFKNGTPEFLSIRFTDKKRGFVVGSVLNSKEEVVDSLVLQTMDGGETWSRIIVPSKAELFHLDFNGSSHGWIVGDKGLILATTDGGASWHVQSSGTDRALYNVDFRDDKEGYVVGGGGTILRTEDGGRNWEKVKTNFPDTFLRVNFADDKNGWIVGRNGTILRSSDRGKTWVKQESRTKANLYGLYMTKKFGFAVGADGMILSLQK